MKETCPPSLDGRHNDRRKDDGCLGRRRASDSFSDFSTYADPFGRTPIIYRKQVHESPYATVGRPFFTRRLTDRLAHPPRRVLIRAAHLLSELVIYRSSAQGLFIEVAQRLSLVHSL